MEGLSEVVVEYDEEIPYDQDLAIRYSPFPIHQLCPLVAAHGGRAQGLVPEHDLHTQVDMSDETPKISGCHVMLEHVKILDYKLMF